MGRSQRQVELFGSMFCPYCHQAISLLRGMGVEFSQREVVMIFGLKPPLPAFLEMKRRSGQRTVPQIFIDGEHYGDEERLFEDDRSGVLASLIFKDE